MEALEYFKKNKIRVRVEVGSFHGLKKYVFYVPRRKVHIVRRALTEIVPMAIYYDVRVLRLWECRFHKYQVKNELK